MTDFSDARRRTLVRGAAGALALAAAPGRSAAQAFPSKPVVLVVPYAVGGTTDIVGRLVAQAVGGALGQPMVVENRTGGGGTVGWGAVARAAPDGHTLLTTEMSFTIAPGLLPSMPLDARKDFAHVVTVASAPHVLVVNPSVPATTVQQFVAHARANPGRLNYGSGGNGTNTHLGAELFKSLTGTFMVHIPYRGAGAVLADLMSGQVQMLVTSLPTALPHIRSGRLRALLITSDRRASVLPDVPSAPEAGLPKMVTEFWVGIAAPAATPPAVVERLNATIAAAINAPDARQRLAAQGLEPALNTPAQATRLVESEIARWASVIRTAGIKPD